MKETHLMQWTTLFVRKRFMKRTVFETGSGVGITALMAGGERGSGTQKPPMLRRLVHLSIWGITSSLVRFVFGGVRGLLRGLRLGIVWSTPSPRARTCVVYYIWRCPMKNNVNRKSRIGQQLWLKNLPRPASKKPKQYTLPLKTKPP